ncbi:MAG: hypothetical protein ABI321_01015, partial [Polyangia bacterium]
SFRRGCAFALIAIGSAFTSGCAANDISVTIDRFVEATGMAGNCGADPTVTTSLSGGVFDAEVSSYNGNPGYVASFVLTNNLFVRIDEAMSVDTQSFAIDAYDVELEVTGPATTVIPVSERRFSVSASSVLLRPTTSQGASVSLFSPKVVAGLIGLGTNLDAAGGSSVTAKIRAHVKRAEEQHVTAYSSIPVDICFGCLLQANASTQCADVSDAAITSGNVCNPAQDKAITCCMAGSNEFCGANIPTKAGP